MKIVNIKRFKDSTPNRVDLISVLVRYNENLGLRNAKINADSLAFEIVPFKYKIEEIKIQDLIDDLTRINIEFEVE